MKFKGFDKVSFEESAKFLPGEQVPLLKSKKLSGGLVYFVGEAVGEVAWVSSEEKKTGELLSIYVLPEARRLGAGGLLLMSAVKQMQKAGLTGISFKYNDTGDRATLTPFFNSVGFETEVNFLPLGRNSLLEIAEALAKKGIDKAALAGTSLYELTNKERADAREVLAKLSGQDMNIYDKAWPGTYVIRDEKGIHAAAFMREESKDVLSLDYLVNKGSPKELAGLFDAMVKRLKIYYKDNVMVEMLLVSDASKKLYEAMFGEPEYNYRMAVCNQSFSEF